MRAYKNQPDIVIRPENTCSTVEQMLNSPTFHEVLKRFNEEQRQFLKNRYLDGSCKGKETVHIVECEQRSGEVNTTQRDAGVNNGVYRTEEHKKEKTWKDVTPEDIQKYPGFAEQVYSFWLKCSVSFEGSANDLAEFQSKVVNIFRTVQRRVREMTAEKVKTPDWIKESFTTIDAELPKYIVDYLEICYQKAQEKSRYSETDAPNGNMNIFDGKYEVNARTYRAISMHAMNNFYILAEKHPIYADPADDNLTYGEIFGPESFRLSERKSHRTQKEFHHEIQQIMQQEGIVLPNLQAFCGDNDPTCAEKNFYLFPVFLEMLKRGYSIRDLIG